jgi:hypothetical protein
VRLLIPLFLLAGCVDATEDDLPGKLVQVEVITTSEDCRPTRFAGDAGVQFFGERADGGLVFTMGQQAQFGPMLDGGSLESVQRQLVPAPNGGRATVGTEARCEGSFSAWERTTEGLQLSQEWPGADACLSGPVWLPFTACASTRRYVFTEVGTCQLRCVRISSRGEVDCVC